MHFITVLLRVEPLYSASVEIIPFSPEPGPFLLVDGHLGVPKTLMYRLYLTAASQHSKHSTISPWLVACTSIIILANPAHQTALNARKRCIQLQVLDANIELGIVAAMVTGIKDCAKQSIIWEHRRWILRHLYLGQHIPVDSLQKELDLITRAAELYPRNYFAWNHWQYIMELLHSSDNLLLLRGEFDRTTRWIELHIADYSATHHLCTVFHRLGPDSFGISDANFLGDHAFSLVERYPDHEALWMYLRVAVLLLDNPGRLQYVARIRTLKVDSPLSRTCVRILNDTRDLYYVSRRGGVDAITGLSDFMFHHIHIDSQR